MTLGLELSAMPASVRLLVSFENLLDVHHLNTLLVSLTLGSGATAALKLQDDPGASLSIRSNDLESHVIQGYPKLKWVKT
jgi:hypothetical protein